MLRLPIHWIIGLLGHLKAQVASHISVKRAEADAALAVHEAAKEAKAAAEKLHAALSSIL